MITKSNHWSWKWESHVLYRLFIIFINNRLYASIFVCDMYIVHRVQYSVGVSFRWSNGRHLNRNVLWRAYITYKVLSTYLLPTWPAWPGFKVDCTVYSQTTTSRSRSRKALAKIVPSLVPFHFSLLLDVLSCCSDLFATTRLAL